MVKKNLVSKKKTFSLIVILVLLVLFSFNKLGSLRGFFHQVARPPAKFLSILGGWFSEKGTFLSSIGDLKKENELLVEESLKLKTEVAQLKDIKKENEELRRQIELAPRKEFKMEASLVIGKEMSGQGQVVYLDKGSSNGVKEGMAVATGEGVLVGKITKVFPNSSRARLIIDQGMKVNIEILESETKGIIEGQYGTSAMVNMLPQTVEVNEGDTIITSGVGSILPRGLLVGHINTVSPTGDHLFQQATVIFPEQFGKLRVAWIVK